MGDAVLTAKGRWTLAWCVGSAEARRMRTRRPKSAALNMTCVWGGRAAAGNVCACLGCRAFVRVQARSPDTACVALHFSPPLAKFKRCATAPLANQPPPPSNLRRPQSHSLTELALLALSRAPPPALAVQSHSSTRPHPRSSPFLSTPRRAPAPKPPPDRRHMHCLRSAGTTWRCPRAPGTARLPAPSPAR